jgi:hypothetical protein
MTKSNIEKYDESVKIVVCDKSFTDNINTSFDAYLDKLKFCQTGLLSNLSTTRASIHITNDADMYSLLIKLANDCLDILTRCKKITKDMIITNNRTLFEKKNQDYGNSFEDFAIIGIIVRLNDKINRIANLSKSNSKKVIIDESVEDTINDLYNYCIIGLMFG